MGIKNLFNTTRRTISSILVILGLAAFIVAQMPQPVHATAKSAKVQASDLKCAGAEKKSGGEKAVEKKCGDGTAKEKKCGDGKSDSTKAKGMKCGEGKCGDAKSDSTKAKETKCGQGKCGN